MTRQTKTQTPKPALASPVERAKREKQKAETMEVLGRHKNSGQKDHKGAR